MIESSWSGIAPFDAGASRDGDVQNSSGSLVCFLERHIADVCLEQPVEHLNVKEVARPPPSSHASNQCLVPATTGCLISESFDVDATAR